MEVDTGRAYPNKKKKSELYEIHLSYRDFLCSPDEYSEQIELVKRAEKNDQEVCRWYIDVDGKTIVADLSLSNPYSRIEITPSGFEKIGASSRKSLAARKQRVASIHDIDKLFTPRNAIQDPLRFVGRSAQIRKIFESDLSRGRLFIVSGERSTGKTSLSKMLVHYFNGNSDLADYYGLTVSDTIGDFHPIFIDINSGVYDCEHLCQEILFLLDPKTSSGTVASNKFTFNAIGLAKYERTYSSEYEKRSSEQRLSSLFTLFAEEGKRIVIIIDEFDSFEDAERLAKNLRHWTTHGLICFVAHTGEKSKSLFRGHQSLTRNTETITLGPLPENEFKEIFYLAGELADTFLRFDEPAIDLIYKASGGLPFFGQLFGDLLIKHVGDKFGTIEKYWRDTKVNGIYTIHNDDVVEVLTNMSSHYTPFEDQVREILKHMPNGESSLMSLANNDNLVIKTDSIKWLEEDETIDHLITEHNGRLKITDPVLRQYILITRTDWLQE